MTVDKLFAPRTVAVVGASHHGGKLGAVMARSLAGYGGGPLLVNTRNPDPAAGVHPTVGAAVEATGRPVDLAVLCVPALACASALADAAAAGAAAALVCAGGFAEDCGERYQRDLERVVADTGVRLLGPNTSGFFAPRTGLVASFVPGVDRVPAGGVAVVAASGGVNHALAFALANAGNGVSLGVGIGAGLDVGTADVLEHLRTDEATTAVALHLETVPDGPRLVAAVRALTETKPVVALVVGQTDVGDFARSHTGALATSWRTTRAALRQTGAVVVDDERELVDALTALSRVRLTPNPDPGIDLLAVYALVEPGSVDLVAAAKAAGLPGRQPVVFATGGLDDQVREVRAQLHEAGLPCLTTPSAAENALRALAADARGRSTPPPVGDPAPIEGSDRLDEAQAKAFLVDRGIAVPPNRVCATRAEAHQALTALGGPVAVKILDASVIHKTEIGGVHIGVSTSTEMEHALNALDDVGARRYLVESMAGDGVDLVVGARRDPVFGPIVLVGLGGTAAEALSDVTIRLAPLSPAQAARMPDELLGHRLLDGWRGGPVLDRDQFGRVVATIANTLAATPDLAEIEINPLRVTHTGLVALDAVIRRTEEETHAH